MNEQIHQRNIESIVISFDIRLPEEEEMQKLTISEEQKVYDIVRLRKIDGDEFSLEYTTMPVNLIPGLTIDVLKGSIYAYIVEKLGLSIGQANRIVRADKSDIFDQKYLHLKEDEPVLELEQVAYLSCGKPFEYSYTRDHYLKRELTYVP
jgi:GntR family transcriptional regulator